VPIRLRACEYGHPGRLAILVNSLVTFMRFPEACNGDDGCLCSNGTVTAIAACQQCYFSTIISENRKMPDPRAGSTPALAGGSAFIVSQGVRLTFTCSVRCGLSSIPRQCHRPGYRSCPSAPTRLARTYGRASEPWGDDSLRHDWRSHWRWVHRNHLYYVVIWTGGIVVSVSAFASSAEGVRHWHSTGTAPLLWRVFGNT
jgi:hypothetical protein